MKRIIPILILLISIQHTWAQENATNDTFDPAFVHSVYFWLHNPDSDADRTAFETALKTLLKESRYTKTNYIGTAPKAIRDVVDDSFTYKLIVTFESGEEQEKYQNEEAHLKFIEDAKHLWKKVLVYDAVELAD